MPWYSLLLPEATALDLPPWLGLGVAESLVAAVAGLVPMFHCGFAWVVAVVIRLRVGFDLARMLGAGSTKLEVVSLDFDCALPERSIVAWWSSVL